MERKRRSQRNALSYGGRALLLLCLLLLLLHLNGMIAQPASLVHADVQNPFTGGGQHYQVIPAPRTWVPALLPSA